MESTDSSSGSQQPHLPPGFRFHPTDEELVVHYLKKKATSAPLPVTIIAEVDLYKFDPWELPGKANFGEQEWYFFSPRDRKYPNGARPNRAATSGYWKATGTDKPILTSVGTHKVGVKKALVFYGGKPPKGIKTNWIMHEYRLADSSPSSNRPPSGDSVGNKASLRLDDWVLCRIYKKNNNSNSQRPIERGSEDSMERMIVPQQLPTHAPAITRQPNLRPQVPQRAGNNYSALLDNGETFFEGLLTEDGIPANTMTQLGAVLRTKPTDLSMVPAAVLKRTLASPFRSDTGTIAPPPAKRFLACNGGCSGSNNNTANNHNNNTSSNSSTNNDANHTITMLLNQIPQGTAYHQPPILGPLGDRSGAVLRQQFQLSGVNWST